MLLLCSVDYIKLLYFQYMAKYILKLVGSKSDVLLCSF